MTCYIGHSNKTDIRYNATSGGVGTTIVKYLFDNKMVGTAISFEFGENYYTPKLVYSFDDFYNVGSIYHEIDIINFIRENIVNIVGNIVVFCLPCQVKAIRYILTKHNIKSYIIALACSSQQTKEATDYLIKRSKSITGKINDIRYRGDGWPGGVKIDDSYGNTAYYWNNDSLWKEIFHSKLFILKKCFKCNETVSKKSDISLADPWVIEKVEEEKNGNSLIFANNKIGVDIIDITIKEKYVEAKELDYDKAIISQKSTILRKRSYIKHKKLVSLYVRIRNKKTYRHLVLKYPILFKIHCFATKVFEKILIKIK